MRTEFRVSNHSVFGVMCKPKNNNKDLNAHLNRNFHLEKPNKVKTGDLLITPNKKSYILINDREISGYAIYIGLHANTTIDIKTTVEFIHPVTKRVHHKVSDEPVPTPACQEVVMSEDEKGFGIQVTRYYVSGELSPESVVNGKSIKNVRHSLGITQFEVA